ncbi:hypothetical protein Tco_1107522 [Tanacetum coccineum]
MKLKRTHESVLINNGVFFLSVLNGVNNDPTKTKLKWNKQLTRCGAGAVFLYGKRKFATITVTDTYYRGISGESEDNICELFTKAFIREIDAIALKRKNLQRETDMRIVAQLLICMDEPHRATNDGNKKSKQAFYAGIIMLHSILKMINHLDSISLMKLLLEGRDVPIVHRVIKVQVSKRHLSCNMDIEGMIHKFNGNWDTDLIHLAPAPASSSRSSIELPLQRSALAPTSAKHTLIPTMKSRLAWEKVYNLQLIWYRLSKAVNNILNGILDSYRIVRISLPDNSFSPSVNVPNGSLGASVYTVFKTTLGL